MADGYDAEGHLLNVDYPPTQKPSPGGASSAREAETSSDPGKAGATFPNGGRLEGAQTLAPADRLTTLATEINAITEQTRGVVISAALAVGKRLIEAKSLCPAGRFGEWLASAVSYSERKAQDMMRLYVEYGRDGAIPESIAALDYSKAVALLAAPAEAREALAAEAVEEDLSVRALQRKIDLLKAEKLKAQMTIDDLEGKIEGQRDEIARLDDREQEYDRAIVERDEKLKAATLAIEKERGEARLAKAKAAAAEASADQLRKRHSDAEERAAASAQRASDAVNRANQTAKDLAEARARIAELEEEARRGGDAAPAQTVEVVPEAVTRELDDLRRQLAEARSALQKPSPGESADAGEGDRGNKTPMPPLSGEGDRGSGGGVSATEKFKWFYANQMKPAFTTALELLREVARESPNTADLFATALTKGCQQLMNQLGTKEG